MQKSNSKGRLSELLPLLPLFCVMLALNCLMPLHRDDYDYSMVWGTARHIQSWGDIFQSVYQHYLLHGGRVVTVFVLDSGLYLGKPLFDVANAAVFTALLLLLYFHARRELAWRGDRAVLLMGGLLSWLSYPSFGEIAIWKSGSTVYLWSAFFAAAFLLPYNICLKRAEAAGSVAGGKPWQVPLMFFLGLLGGCSVENLAVTTVAIAFGCSWYLHRRRQAVPGWMKSGAAGALLGMLVIIAAPGNYVRYGDQGSGKGLLIHLGNQFAGNGAMLLYALPAVLLLFCCYRLLKLHLAGRDGVEVFSRHLAADLSWSRLVAMGVLTVLAVSYFNGCFVGTYLGDAIIYGILTPLGYGDAKTVEHFRHTMSYFEEMMIYWMLIILAYSALKERLGIAGKGARAVLGSYGCREVLNAFPEARYAAFLVAAALFNNFVMVAAPTFPERATFSSVAMLMVAAMAILRMPAVRCALLAPPARGVLTLFGGAMAAFTVSASLFVIYHVSLENDVRIEAVREAGSCGRQVVIFEPMETRNRVMRHVFFKDFDNSVTKDGLCKFYGIRDIQVTGAGEK